VPLTLPAIVLAAGDSTRMGRPKALLAAPDRRPFVLRIVDELLAAGVTEIVIVTGRHHEAIAEVIGRDGERVRLARNLDPDRGQLSSVWVGMDAVVTPASDGLMLTLVDVPLVTAGVIRQVIDTWGKSRAPIVRPAIGSRHGHPVIFDRAVLPELRVAPLDVGAKFVVRAHAAEIVDVPVDDDGCLVDVDTPSDYEALTRGPADDTSA
jgi:CTP:molybdopterin cytidylyltransferase MocA